MERRPVALFTLHDTSRAEEFGRVLISLGWEIVATAETFPLLRQAGLPITDIADFVGITDSYPFPPTLHPKMELYLTSSDGPRIDLVYIIPYPLTIGIDVGGWTLLSLAAKGERIPVMSHGDMERTISEIRAVGHLTDESRSFLIAQARAFIARQDLQLLGHNLGFDGFIGRACTLLRNGENPYQVPAHLFDLDSGDPLALPSFRQVSGEPPCFTNLADTDCLLQTMSLAVRAFQRNRGGAAPSIAIAAKHGNACGFATNWSSPAEAVERALFGNPTAVWGGEFIVNFPIDASLAGLLHKSQRRQALLGSPNWMLDVVVAPDISPEAVEVLGARTGRKLFVNPALAEPFPDNSPWTYRPVRGGFLRQPSATYVLDLSETEAVGGTPTAESIDDLIIAWSVAWSSSLGGNEIALARRGCLLGAGGGPSTLEAARAATATALSLGHPARGAVFAANAFFPFTDAPAVLADAGAHSGLVPAGGRREGEIRAFFEERDIAMVYLPERFRGFSRH